MLKKHRSLIESVAKKVIVDQKQSAQFSRRIENEIKSNKNEMIERRKSFNLIRNK